MIEMFFMRGTAVITISRNVTAVPRLGDFVVISGVKVAVKEVIWHLDHATWVEVQI
jgi:hypothetical protein